MHKSIITCLAFLSLASSAVLAEEPLTLQEAAPDRYVVLKGDTLWEISGKFLKEPWRWPEIWQMNKAQIKNPHLIYPGDVIVLDKAASGPRLSLLKNGKLAPRDQGAPGGLETVRLSPQVRTEALQASAIPSISPNAIAPFLSQPLILEEDTLQGAPYIAGAEEERVVLGAGDVAYAVGARAAGVVDWKIYRPGKTLIDPETNEVLGNEAVYLGEAQLIKAGEPATIEIIRAPQEITIRDRLLPAGTEPPLTNQVPHAPDKLVTGRIISAYGSVSDVGQYATVVINRGRRDNLEVGHVLAVYRKGRTVEPMKESWLKKAYAYLDKDCVKRDKSLSFNQPYDPKETFEECRGADNEEEWVYADIGCLKPGAKVSFGEFFNPKDVYKTHCRVAKRGPVTLPDARTGLVYVYRVFERVSYALVMNISRPVYVMDVVRTP